MSTGVPYRPDKTRIMQIIMTMSPIAPKRTMSGRDARADAAVDVAAADAAAVEVAVDVAAVDVRVIGVAAEESAAVGSIGGSGSG